MKKRFNNERDSSEPPDKKTEISTGDIKAGTMLVDILGNMWKLGKTVGLGGFGEIYLASDDISGDVSADAPFVAKVESHTSGPLFVEIHCYLRIGKAAAIKQWKTDRKTQHLAIPHYVAYGSHTVGDNKYRFLILPRYEKDLQAIFDVKRKFNLKTALTISLQIVDALEYLHDNGYVHSDIKASNILYNEYKKKPSTPNGKSIRYSGCRPVRTCKVRKIQRVLRTNFYLYNEESKTEAQPMNNIDQIFLLDYGLACKYVTSTGEPKPYDYDSRKAHAGTILFCSRDAHEGAQSPRSDLECLGFNLIYWLTSDLPWSKSSDPETVHKKKCRYMQNLKPFLEYAFNFEYPRFLYDYFTYLQSLEFERKPDYSYIRTLFGKALKEYGYKDDLLLDFDNREGWGRKQKKTKCNSENVKVKCAKMLLQRAPLQSNLPVRRKVIKRDVVKRKKDWISQLVDPEVIIKRARERKLTDTSENSGIQNLDIHALNPTSAMLDVFNKSMERLNSNGHSPRDRGDIFATYIEGYTPAMVEVYNRMKERQYLEYQAVLAKLKRSKKKAAKRVQSAKSKVSQAERATVNKKDKSKVITLKRTYSLRG
ncbi:hypothetical protein PPYR_13935 [Photinus pyralis]|uniref:non-specific serine/threonine protein kinase n=1 Tax=Photinus pyralis TaxID=7054 RepID=A0A1Y1KHM7_PHOPY|nr:serine/threonine-protein kinase VRK1-like [Photinus pyralis]KAB0791974.1 hypothetical protein PPYR_13935 [Photinus pyralis]